MASVAQRYPALIFPSSLFRKPDARCAATGDDGFKAPDRAAVSSAASSSPDYKPLDLGPAELKLSLQDEPAGKKKEEVRKLEVEGEIGASRTRILEEFRKGLKDKSAGELALYGGIAGVGLAIGGSVLSSLEVLPLVPEALQAVGVGYSILIAGRALKGKNNVLVATSPFKAISELVDSSENSRVQRTTDMDEAVVQALEKLAKERDAAVNKVEEMKQAASDFARLAAEKEALEAVAMELVKERDSAISEVSGLRKAVEAMQGRISSVEKALAQEVQQFRQQNEALEVLACQLATERDSALQEVARLKEMASQSERSEAEKQSLEAVALRLTEERDGALQELEQLKKASKKRNLSPLRASDSGLTPEQELFIKEKVRAARSQYIDISQGYDKQWRHCLF
ncbi:hypothetical protein SELMODRAFT_423707 [Selaginella moellendorffii]|uniref:Cyanobacterial aminoacyl-tRNA synthetase CAAD domain-containing protein n=1 Tax=Selaginella moellendorffii TaxID=88036 RepID=D8SMM1_SELML|nr:hypothetical protein SELMODRAFT_423707 [Selaginella moellendorffii]